MWGGGGNWSLLNLENCASLLKNPGYAPESYIPSIAHGLHVNGINTTGVATPQIISFHRTS